MKYKSLWLDDVKEDINVKSLDKNISCDVLIIGGGMTGLSCAFGLMNTDKKVVVVEANQVGMGISLRTTGKITYLQEDIYSKLASNYDLDISKLYYDSQREAIDILTNTINDYRIDCDLENVTSYVFTNKESEIDKLVKEKDLLRKFGADVSDKNMPIEIDSKYQISCDDTYVFHPLKYLRGLKRVLRINGVDIYENTKIIDIDKKDYFYCRSDKYTIKSKQIVLACHYPFFFASCLLPIKSYIEKSFIMSIDKQKDKRISLINLSKPIKSVRFYRDKMLFLSSASLLCDKLDFVKRRGDLVRFLDDKASISHCWSNHDIMTNDYLPIIGEIYKDVFIGTGYNTWGMTNSTIAGKIISDLITNNTSKYKSLFSPNRSINRPKIINLPLCLYASIKGYIGPYFTKKIVKYDTIDNEKVAIYKGHIVYRKCPHMKCNLIFNALEETWDCPCHGSRFNYDGTYIIGPSREDIVFKGKK